MPKFIHTISRDYTNTQNFYAMVFKKWPEHERDINQNNIEKLYDILLSTLTEQEIAIVKLRSGFEGSPMAYFQIGELQYLSSERVRQILMKALRKLRLSKNSNKIKPLFATRDELMAELIEYKRKLETLEQCLSDTNFKLCAVIKELPPGITIDDTYFNKLKQENTSVDELGLSNSVTTALIRSGIYRLADITKLSLRSLRDLRNIGKGSIRQIEKSLAQHGLSLQPDDN